jgi:hypothetical protein
VGTRQELGWLRLSAGSVRLESRTAKLSAQDRCHRQNNFEGRADKPSEPRTLHWRLDQNRNGQTVLLLKDADGRETAYNRDPSVRPRGRLGLLGVHRNTII